jgi:hypothetical protein
MLTRRALSSLALAAPLARARLARAAAPAVKVVPEEKSRRVQVLADGQPFTAYIWPERVKKPALFPLRAASGKLVTRGYPLEPRPGEAADHPHHVGLWLNYGDVDGLDFWGHSEATKGEGLAKAGTIYHRGIKRAAGGAGSGTLVVGADWVKGVAATGPVVLREETSFTFHAAAGRRAVDRVSTLTAAAGPVGFPDNKEGMLGLRLCRSLDHPSTGKAVVVGPDGRPGEKSVPLDPKAATGRYTSSEGVTAEAVWGTRARWMMVTGVVEGEPLTVAILDHPKNPGHPTYWHARGYGLFAANPLGQKVFSKGKETLDLKLPKGGSVRFAYRVLVLTGHAKPAEMDGEWKRFVGEVA